MKATCLVLMKDLETKNLDKLSNWFNHDNIVWIPPCKPVKGINRILALFRGIFHRYEALHWKVVEILGLENNRCLYISESWGRIGSQEYQNKIVTDIIFDDDGKIISLSDYFKDTSRF
ncbi:MAG: nuclear transport factor 2 family protein [Chitinophagaceae bacterium]